MAEPDQSLQLIHEVKDQLRVLNLRLHRKTSFRYVFLLAVVQGIGYAVGAAILASIVIAIIARALVTVDYVPYLNEVLSSEQLQETISQ